MQQWEYVWVSWSQHNMLVQPEHVWDHDWLTHRYPQVANHRDYQEGVPGKWPEGFGKEHRMICVQWKYALRALLPGEVDLNHLANTIGFSYLSHLWDQGWELFHTRGDSREPGDGLWLRRII